MKGKKNEDEHENLERWLITYADLITLLLAFFIMMYTFSKQDAQKYEEVSHSLRTIFKGGSGVLKAGSGTGSSLINPFVKAGAGGEIKKELEDQVSAMADTLDEGHTISVLADERGIVIRVTDRTFFDPGKAELKDTARDALRKIAPILEKSKSQVRIEGHTDNVPINTSEFKSNWELSTRRATEVVRYLIERYNFPPDRICASGYAEYRPVAANDTSVNRALNRRIEIVLMSPQGK
jgi:chemotaxis protein MotB